MSWVHLLGASSVCALTAATNCEQTTPTITHEILGSNLQAEACTVGLNVLAGHQGRAQQSRRDNRTDCEEGPACA